MNFFLAIEVSSHYNVAVMGNGGGRGKRPGALYLLGMLVSFFLIHASFAHASDALLVYSYLNSHEGSAFADLGDVEYTNGTSTFLAKKVAHYIDYFATEGRDDFQQWLDQAGPYLPLIREILQEQGVPEELALLPLIESGFNVNARSPKKALGLWQFMASTGELYGLKINKLVDERKDPVKSTRAAARHLKDLYSEFGTWPLALASYNAGSGKVRRALARTGASTYWEIGQGRALKTETKNYIPKFMAALIIAKNPDFFGFTVPEGTSFEHNVIEIPGGMDLRTIAKASGIDYTLLRKLNPELKGQITPYEERSYSLRLPEGIGTTFIENFDKLPASERVVYREHKVRKGDTVNEIARRYGTSALVIKEVNSLNKRFKIVPGDTILVPESFSFDEKYVTLMTFSIKQPDT